MSSLRSIDEEVPDPHTHARSPVRATASTPPATTAAATAASTSSGGGGGSGSGSSGQRSVSHRSEWQMHPTELAHSIYVCTRNSQQKKQQQWQS